VFCPQCGNRISDDALTSAPGLTPTPPPLTPTPDDEERTRFAGPDDALTVARAPRDDSQADALTIAAPPGSEPFGEAMTIAGTAEDAMTVVASPESLADAMTVATPVSSTAGTTGSGRRPRRSVDGGPLEIGQSFGPRYHIIRLLGAGGMGAVYQAWDAELGVAVAIKVIRPEVMDDPATAEEVSRRFKRELLLARQVTHKNVVRIHDIGDIDGIKYITMSYVEGIDLSTILRRDGKQSVPDVLRIARAVVGGLVAAHTAGVVHRDLKPANIMIGADGQALIMDFGIAHSTGDPAAPAAGAGLVPEKLRRAASHHAATTVGSIVGTLEYMAPEQARGQPVDQRVDVYAFGLILYDILLGRRRVSSGQAAVEELQRRMEAAPPPLQALDKEIPPAVAALVGRCVEPDAEKRFQTSADVAAELAKLDDQGKVIPIARRLTKRVAAVAALVVVALLGTTFYVTRRAVAPVEAHAPLLVLIADLQNQTGDSTFNHALEPTLTRMMQGTSFITAYDRTRLRPQFGVTPPQNLDLASAREIARNHGLSVVLAGLIAPRGGGYEISMTASEAITGNEIGRARARASGKEQVLAAAEDVATELRKALGDHDSESARLFASRTMSTKSLEAVKYHALAAEALSNNKFAEARDGYLKAVERDKNFGLAYQGLAVASRNLDQFDKADEYIQTALKLIDGMTEREAYGTRGFYYRSLGDYQKCVEQYGQLTQKFAADVGGHNQRALCLSKLRQLKPAVEEMREVVKILPKRVLYRSNLALYAAYAGDYETAEREARAVQEPDAYVQLALAFSQIGQGLIRNADATYRGIAKIGTQGNSIATSGLGDLALYEGRFNDAIRILRDGVTVDVKEDNAEKAARKLTSIAYAQLSLGRTAPAVEAAEQSLVHTSNAGVRLLAGMTLAQAGSTAKAEQLAQQLNAQTTPEPRAYGKIVAGEVALKKGDAAGAAKLFAEANGLLDTWLGHFALGRAYLAANQPLDAETEFSTCINRRGEALSLLLDEEPTYGYFPMALYYRGVTREQIGTAGYRDAFRQYVSIRGISPDDPLLKDVRRRAQ